jgi:uncharacterized small protein (DUF1192 family)
MIEDDEPAGRLLKKPARVAPLPLDGLGVSELGDYIAELRAEILRAEVEIDHKQSHRSAADTFFKPRD